MKMNDEMKAVIEETVKAEVAKQIGGLRKDMEEFMKRFGVMSKTVKKIREDVDNVVKTAV